MDYKPHRTEELVQLSRLALTGRREDVQMYIRRLARKLMESDPETAEEMIALLREMPSAESPFRNASVSSVPVDLDSRLQLVRLEHPVQLDIEPIWTDAVRKALEQVISERERQEELFAAGLLPAKSVLFTGSPGVGKTLAARWTAQTLGLPLLILNLSVVMSSFLGRTGSNIRNVFDYAKGVDCILLLDELDAVAKRRDDAAEIGELKRLVNVLLQEIDDWKPSGLLVAATNHSSLLDPAIWRRFDMVVDFPMPNREQTLAAARLFLGPEEPEVRGWMELLANALQGSSYNDIERELLHLRREAVIHELTLDDAIQIWLKERVKTLKPSDRRRFAAELVRVGYSQREVSEWTGVSRDTIRGLLRSSKRQVK